MKVFICVFGLHLSVLAMAEDQKVIYQYKKYEKFDLGNMEVKGQLIAPGDISVRERERKRFEMDLYTRQDFESFIEKDIDTLR
jgi:hypothetical protein